MAEAAAQQHGAETPNLDQAIHAEGLEPVGTAAHEGVAPHTDPKAVGMDATAWVSLAMAVFIAILLFKKVPALIGKALDGRIAQIREQLAEASKLRAEAEVLEPRQARARHHLAPRALVDHRALDGDDARLDRAQQQPDGAAQRDAHQRRRARAPRERHRLRPVRPLRERLPRRAGVVVGKQRAAQRSGRRREAQEAARTGQLLADRDDELGREGGEDGRLVEGCRAKLDSRCAMAVEFRSRRWLEPSGHSRLVAWLRDLGVALVASDDLEHELNQPDRSQRGLQADTRTCAC